MDLMQIVLTKKNSTIEPTTSGAEFQEEYRTGRHTSMLCELLQINVNQLFETETTEPSKVSHRVSVFGIVEEVFPPLEEKDFLLKTPVWVLEFEIRDPSIPNKSPPVFCRLYADRCGDLPKLEVGSLVRLASFALRRCRFENEPFELRAKLFKRVDNCFGRIVRYRNEPGAELTPLERFGCSGEVPESELDDDDAKAVARIREWYRLRRAANAEFATLENDRVYAVEGISRLHRLKLESLSLIRHNKYQDLAAQVVSVAIGDCNAVLRVWDGTRVPKRHRPGRAEEGPSWFDPVVKLTDDRFDLPVLDAFEADIVCWGKYKECVINRNVKPGDIVLFLNLHFFMSKPRRMAETDQPLILRHYLTMHEAKSFTPHIRKLIVLKSFAWDSEDPIEESQRDSANPAERFAYYLHRHLHILASLKPDESLKGIKETPNAPMRNGIRNPIAR